MSEAFDPWPEGYKQYDVASVDAVTVLDVGKAVVWMTDAGGLKVCMVIPLGDLFGATHQIAAHAAPNVMHPKHPLPTIN